MTHEDAVNAVELLKQLQASRAQITEFVKKAVDRWPHARNVIKRQKGFEEDL